MEHPCVSHANEWAAQRIVGEPLRQFPGGEPLDQMLFDRQVKTQRVAVDEHETWPPEAVVEDERDRHEHGDRQAGWPGGPSGDGPRVLMCISARLAPPFRIA